MKVNVRYFLTIPIIIFGIAIKSLYSDYQKIIEAEACINNFGVKTICSGLNEIMLMVFFLSLITICISFLLKLDKKIKWVWK